MRKAHVAWVVAAILFPAVADAQGDIVAYSTEGGKAAVFRVNPDGSNLRQVAENALNPVWSPDGKLLAFVRGSSEAHSALVISDENGKVLHEVVGMEARRADGHPVEKIIADQAWSQDGTRVAFLMVFSAGTGAQVEMYDLVAGKTRTLCTVPAKDQLTSLAGSVAWTADGNKILVLMSGFGVGIFDLATDRFAKLAEAAGWPRLWNRSKVVFRVETPSGEVEFWVSNLDGSEKTLVAMTKKRLFPVARAIARDRLLLSAIWSEDAGLYALDLKTRSIDPVGVDEKKLLMYPEFSPDGTKLIGMCGEKSETRSMAYCVYDLADHRMSVLKTWVDDRGEAFWMALPLGGSKGFSWR